MRILHEALAQRVLLTDGALTRQLRKRPIDVERDLWGHPERLELLCLTRAGWVRSLHESYLRAGADLVRTHTLEASPLSLEAAGLADQAFYLNFAAAQIACEAVDSVPGRGRRRFVLGLVRDQGWDAPPAETGFARLHSTPTAACRRYQAYVSRTPSSSPVRARQPSFARRAKFVWVASGHSIAAAS